MGLNMNEEEEMIQGCFSRGEGGGFQKPMKLVVGYALTSKKTKSFLQPKLEGLARYRFLWFFFFYFLFLFYHSLKHLVWFINGFGDGFCLLLIVIVVQKLKNNRVLCFDENLLLFPMNRTVLPCCFYHFWEPENDFSALFPFRLPTCHPLSSFLFSFFLTARRRLDLYLFIFNFSDCFSYSVNPSVCPIMPDHCIWYIVSLIPWFVPKNLEY